MKSYILTLFFFSAFLFNASSQNFVEQDCDFTNIHLGQISIASEDCVWATGRNFDGQLILEFTRSTDGGSTWQKGIYHPCITCAQISHLLALDCDRAYAVVFYTFRTGGLVMRTEDGGTSWDTIQSADFQGPTDFPNWIHFFDDQEAICMGDASDGYLKILRSVDGGDTWSRIPQANIPDTVDGETGWTALFDAVGDTIWFSTSRSRLFRSTDRGQNWEAFDVPGSIQNFKFSDSDNGMSYYSGPLTETDSTYITSDGGETWMLTDSIINGFDIWDIAYAPREDGKLGAYIVSGDSGIYATLDNGNSWGFISNDSSWSFPIAFLNVDVGWVGEFHDGIPGDGILKYVGTVLPAESVKPKVSELQVFPNPTRDQVRLINFDNEEDASYTMYSLDGKTIKQVSPETNGVIDLSSFSTGVYILQKEFNQQLSTAKITLVH